MGAFASLLGSKDGQTAQGQASSREGGEAALCHTTASASLSVPSLAERVPGSVQSRGTRRSTRMGACPHLAVEAGQAHRLFAVPVPLPARQVNEVFIDFENAKPTNQELPIYNMVAETLNQQGNVMRTLLEYKGCQDLARRAMSSPTPENELAAFEGLLNSVDAVALFYNYAKELEKVTPELLTTLTKDGADCKASLSDQQALAKELADIFDFTLRFDALRMERPFLPNDFSYYRRLLPKFNKHPGVKIKDDEASGMALFTAEHIPMMTTLARSCVWDAEDPRNQHVTDALALMANSCLKMIKNKKFQKPATLLFCARAMTGSIVLFDHVSVLGVFHKKSPIAIKQVITLLKKEFPGNDGIILLNAIQFSTKHYKEASDGTKELFNDSQ